MPNEAIKNAPGNRFGILERCEITILGTTENLAAQGQKWSAKFAKFARARAIPNDAAPARATFEFVVFTCTHPGLGVKRLGTRIGDPCAPGKCPLRVEVLHSTARPERSVIGAPFRVGYRGRSMPIWR